MWDTVITVFSTSSVPSPGGIDATEFPWQRFCVSPGLGGSCRTQGMENKRKAEFVTSNTKQAIHSLHVLNLLPCQLQSLPKLGTPDILLLYLQRDAGDKYFYCASAANLVEPHRLWAGMHAQVHKHREANPSGGHLFERGIQLTLLAETWGCLHR